MKRDDIGAPQAVPARRAGLARRVDVDGPPPAAMATR